MPRQLDRRDVLKLAGALMAGSVVLVDPSVAVAADRRPLGLRDVARHAGVRIGSAVDTDALATEVTYRDVLVREFDSVTPENVMKWEVVEPEQGRLDFAAADALVRFAHRHGMIVRGHNLVWHNQLPAWLTDGSFTDAQLRDILRRHIVAEAGHFRGRLDAWDVVNEPIADDGTMRDTIWLQSMGIDYIEQAFRWARLADPHATLYVNDYNIEGLGAKSDAMYALVAWLRRRGVPVGGVGVQGHLDIQYDFPSGVTENLRRFADLGVDVALTEVDVRMTLPATPEKLALQADYYRRLVDACLAVDGVSVTVWGFTDAHSWVPGVFPGEGAATPSDEQYRRKPAYFAVRDALAAAHHS